MIPEDHATQDAEYRDEVVSEVTRRGIFCVKGNHDGGEGLSLTSEFRDSMQKIRYGVCDHTRNTVEIRAVDGPLLPLDDVARAIVQGQLGQ
ncbi:MAG: hypothetical protein JXR37_29650 [Kiritimatiellae bacterium]|nr:hypothetical protein [Kiritimatiellia bacterium]